MLLYTANIYKEGEFGKSWIGKMQNLWQRNHSPLIELYVSRFAVVIHQRNNLIIQLDQIVFKYSSKYLCITNDSSLRVSMMDISCAMSKTIQIFNPNIKMNIQIFFQILVEYKKRQPSQGKYDGRFTCYETTFIYSNIPPNICQLFA